MEKAKSWVKNNKKEFGLLIAILVIGAAMRLYRIDEYMTFLGDEGRDAIIVRRLLLYADPILIGPGTSVGNMYLGPLYYYFMAPWLFLANYSPAGPTIGVALLGIATIFLVWLITKEWFGAKGALLAALLYAVSPTTIIFTKSSWNPNIMPFFALLSIYSIWRIWQKNDFRFFIVKDVSIAFALQSHYLGLLLIPPLVIFEFLTFLKIRSSQLKKSFLKHMLVGGAIFVFLMSPLLIFDIRHDWLNIKAVRAFLMEGNGTLSLNPLTTVLKIYPVYQQIITRLIAGRNLFAGMLTAIILLLGTLALVINQKKSFLKTPYLLLLTWIGIGILGLSFYQQTLYDHYFGFLFPAPFILLGGIVEDLIKKTKLAPYAVASVLLALVFINLLENPNRYSPNRQMQRAQEVADKILVESKGESFNFAVIAERNYEDGYEYFLLVADAKIFSADRRNPSTITDQLFIVCEKPVEKCDPTHEPKPEVAHFGMTKIENTWSVGGITLYKLVHSR